MATVKCTGRDFQGIVDPYTGKTVETVMLVTKSGKCLFAAPDAYSTAEYHQSSKDAFDAWSREAGILGVRAGDMIRCAYTGEELVSEKTSLGYHYVGGFDPNMFRSRAEYLYYVTMRNGKSAFPKPGADEIVESVHEKEKANVVTHEPSISQEAIDRANDAIAKSGLKTKRNAQSGWTKKRK